MHSDGKTNVGSFGLSDEEFQGFSKEMAQVAKQQSKENEDRKAKEIKQHAEDRSKLKSNEEREV